VPLFGHKTQGLCFCYLPNIKFTWNRIEVKKLNSSNLWSFAWWWWFFYMCMYLCINILVKIWKFGNEYISFNIQLNMFFSMKNSYTCCWQLGPQILSLMNIKNQPNGKKNESFSLQPFQNGLCNLQNSCIVYYLIKCIIWTLSNIDVCITYPWIFFEVNCIVFFFKNSFKMKIITKTRIQIILKDSKGHHSSYSHTPIHYNHETLWENAWTNHYNQPPIQFWVVFTWQTTHDFVDQWANITKNSPKWSYSGRQ